MGEGTRFIRAEQHFMQGHFDLEARFRLMPRVDCFGEFRRSGLASFCGWFIK